MRKIAATLLFVSLFSGLFAQHFITDADLRKEVQQDYLRRLDMLNDRAEPLMRTPGNRNHWRNLNWYMAV